MVLDPVGNFHLRNGAALHRLNWNGCSNLKCHNESYGIMANYLYDLEKMETRSKSYILHGEMV